jgi:hypothetical protein
MAQWARGWAETKRRDRWASLEDLVLGLVVIVVLILLDW